MGRTAGPRVAVEAARRPGIDGERPLLLFFESAQSGRCRRVEGFLAQVLQRRHNHDTFKLVRVDVGARPDLAERFRVDGVPAVLVLADKRVRLRLVGPRGCRQLEEALRPWLR
jgi:thioredoxin-like negative regulator of GroEL